VSANLNLLISKSAFLTGAHNREGSAASIGETHAQTPCPTKLATLTKAIRAQENKKECIVVGLSRQHRSNDEEAHDQTEDGEDAAEVGPLASRCAANNLGAAANTHVGALGTCESQCGADQLLHDESIPASSGYQEQFSRVQPPL
jgi:hypothetical protein